MSYVSNLMPRIMGLEEVLTSGFLINITLLAKFLFCFFTKKKEQPLGFVQHNFENNLQFYLALRSGLPDFCQKYILT